MHMFVVHCINGLHNILHGGHVECGLTWVIPAWDDPHHSQSWPTFVAKQYNLMVQCIFSPFLTKKSSQTGMTCGAPLHTVMGSSQTGMNMCCHENLNNTQILINFKCTCFLCIATTGHTMFAWVAYVECGLMCVIPAWDDPHHCQSWPRLVAKHFNLMVQHVFHHF